MNAKKEWEQLTIMDVYGPDIWSGKTSQERSAATAEKTSGRSCKKPQKSQIKMPLFLDLRGGASGLLQDVSWQMGGPLPGEYMMHSFGECPREENESRLSQILEDRAHQKYCLSAKACAGILRRAGKRGKKLPEMLDAALRNQAGQLAFRNAQENQGGGKGILIQEEHTGALSTVNNQSVCCLNDQGGQQMSVSEDVTGTLRAQEHGHQPVVYGIGSYASNAMKSDNPNSGIYEAETARTLDLNGGSPACNQGGMAVVQGFDGYNQSVTGDVSMSLRNKNADSDHIPIVFDASRRHNVQEMGDVCETVQAQYGTGGNNTPIVLEGNGSRDSHKGDGYRESETMYTLNTVEQHAIC